MTHPLAGRSAAEDGGGGTFLPREEWANRGPHGACPVGWKAQGKKVSPALLRLRRSRRSRPSARSSQGEAVWSACRTASSGEDVADVEGPAQEVRLSRRRERSSGVQKGRRHDRIDPDRRWRYPQDMVLSDWRAGADLSKRGKGRLMPRQADDPVIAPISNRSTMRCWLTPLWSRPPGKAMPDLPQPAVPRSAG